MDNWWKPNIFLFAAFLNFLWLFIEYLFVSDCCIDKTSHVNTSFWVLGTCDEHFSVFSDVLKIKLLINSLINKHLMNQYLKWISINLKPNHLSVNHKKPDDTVMEMIKFQQYSVNSQHYRPLQLGSLFDNRKPELVEHAGSQLHPVSTQPQITASIICTLQR